MINKINRIVKRHRFFKIIPIILLLFSVLSPLILYTGRASAAPSYSYATINLNSQFDRCPSQYSDEATTVAIKAVDGNLEYYFCHLPGSTYNFTTTFNGGAQSITVDGATPNKGVLGNIGAAQGRTIAISNTQPFVDKFGDSNTAGSRTNPDIRTGNQNIENQEAAANSNDPNAQDQENNCETHGSEFGIGWIACPLIHVADVGIQWIDDQIVKLLDIDSGYYNNPEMKSAWSAIRTIAFFILIPIMLVMVIGTALDFNYVSPYSVKKALPRMLAAVVFISLSYTICVFLIEMTGLLGRGALGLMTAPFETNGTELTLPSLFEIESGGGIFRAFFAQGAIAIGVIVAVWLFIPPLLMIAATGFIIMLVRQIFLVALLLLAPLAILAWIFPGNDKLWKLWWGAFSKLLMMFPIIMIVIAMGRIFASIIVSGDAGGFQGPLNTLMALVAYLIPYGFIPFTFKLAGGIFGTITGMVNDREKGFFDKQRAKRAQKKADLLSGSAFQDRGVGKYVNSAGRRFGAGWKGRYGFGQRGKDRMDLLERAAAAEKSKDPLMQQHQFNDDGILALGLSAGSESRARSELGKIWGDSTPEEKERIEKAISSAKAMGINRQNSIAALDATARNKSFSLPGGSEGIEAVARAADALGGVTRTQDPTTGKWIITGNKALSDNIMGGFEYQSRAAGRMDLGYHDYNSGKAKLSGAWEKATLGHHAQSAGPSTASFIEHFTGMKRQKDGTYTQVSQGLLHSSDEENRRKAAIALIEMQNLLPHANAGNQDVINGMFDELGIDRTKDIDSQIAQIANVQSNPRELRARARVYDSNVPLGERNPSEES